MLKRVLDAALRRMVSIGTLELTFPDGETRRYGDGTKPRVHASIKTTKAVRRLALNPDLALGETYMDGELVIENDDLEGLLGVAIRNLAAQHRPVWFQKPLLLLRWIGRRINQFNPVGTAQANVAHHYDLSGALYDLFLDKDRQYSCAYFREPEMTLEEAQDAKKHHIAGKLCIRPGMRVLDIGCGWGGMAITLARDYGARVVGVTLSREQYALATRRVEEAGLSDRVEIRLLDYRHVTEEFDRIVSVGMFEHVGAPHFREYFGHVREMLKPDGIALIHTIGRSTPPGITNPWILKYIFPGGYCPAMSEAMAAIEDEHLVTTDVEVWRLHYAKTLRHWHDRFMANIDQARALYDERFCRMWRYYLLASELTFRHYDQVVFQFQLTRDQEAVPLTRDYLYRGESEAPIRHAAE